MDKHDLYTSEWLPISSSSPDQIECYRVLGTSGTDKVLRTAKLGTDADRQLSYSSSISGELAADSLPGVLAFDLSPHPELAVYVSTIDADFCLLEDLLTRPPSLTLLNSLKILRNVTITVGEMHKRQVLHNDIRADAILVTETDLQTYFVNFEYAVRETSLRATVDNPVPTSSIFSAAPELSGRLPYMTDQRSDLYSIGVLFYRLLTSSFPYTGSDTAQVLYGHIAGAIPSLEHKFPKPVRETVTKLLNKSPQSRYQSAAGLLVDVDNMINGIMTGGLDSVFVGWIDDLSQPKVSDNFVGRIAELKGLHDAIKRSNDTDYKNSVCLIHGRSGSGKSYLIENFLNDPATHGFLRATCKFEFAHSTAPFKCLRTLLSDLIAQHIINSPVAESKKPLVDELKEALGEALGEDAPYINDLVPELESFLGSRYTKILETTKAFQIAPKSVEARIHSAIIAFLRTFAKLATPLLLVLDDIQWASMIDLSVILEFLEEEQSVTVMLAYRHDEISEDISQNFLNNLNIDLSVSLDSVELNDIYKLVKGTLRRAGSDVHKLAELVSRRTAGNILFVKQYLQSLFDTNLIAFNFAEQSWEFNLQNIMASEAPAGIIEFLLQRLSTLDDSTRKLLNLCALLAAPVIYLETLLVLCTQGEIDLTRDLKSLCARGLLIMSEGSAIETLEAHSNGLEETEVNDTRPQFRFPHDRVHQTCLQSLQPEERLSLKYHLGRELLNSFDIDLAPASLIVQACDLLTEGLQHGRMPDQEEVSKICRLFMRAAKSANQPSVRMSYLETILLLSPISEDPSIDFHEFLLDSYIAVGNTASALDLIKHLGANAYDTAPKIRLLQREAKIYWMEKKDAEVRRVGEAGLRLAGFDVRFDGSSDELMQQVMGFMAQIPATAQEVTSFNELPVLNDEIYLASQSLLVTILPSIFFVSAQLLAVVLTLGVSTVFQRGISTDGCYLLAFFGIANSDVCSPGYNFPRAKALADLALKLSDKIGKLRAQDADILASAWVLQGGVNAWQLDNRAFLTQIYIEAGANTRRAYNFEYISYSMTNAIGFFGFGRGQELEQIDHHFGSHKWHELIMKGDRLSQLFALPTFQTLEILRQAKDTSEFFEIEGELISNESAIESEIALAPGMHRCNYLRCKVLLSLLSGDLSKTERHLQDLFVVLPAVQGTPDWGMGCILRAVSLLGQEVIGANAEFMTTFRSHLDVWATYCSSDYKALQQFFVAEDLLQNGQTIKAIQLYAVAIDQLLNSGNYLLAGLLAEHCHCKVHDQLGSMYSSGLLYKGIEAFTRWGCPAKARQLRHKRRGSFSVAIDLRQSSAHSPASPPRTSTRQKSVDLRRKDLSQKENSSFVSSPGESITASDTLDLRNLSISKARTETATQNKPTHSISKNDVRHIDLSYVLETTSLLSQESDFGQITKTLLQHLTRAAGASVGAVILQGAQGLQLSALADQHKITRYVDRDLSLPINNVTLPLEIIRLSIYLKERISDSTNRRLSNRPKGSWLVLPLVHQGDAMGAVYIHNESVLGLYTDEKGSIDLIAVLVSQVASQLSRQLVIERLQRNETELIAAKSEAVTALKLKSQFLATMSHEIRTPFNSILGFSSLLLDMNLDEQQTQMAESIQNSSKSLLAVINDILDFSQIEQGAMILRPTSFDITSLVQDTIESIMPLVLSRNLDVVHSQTKATREMLLHGDAGRIRQCLMNLLSNAVKFSSDNIVLLKTGLDIKNDGRVLLTAAVTDRGIGIAKEDQEKLFQHFSQVDNSSTRDHEGTGLGLAITKRIAQLFDGDVVVESSPGHGSTFTATFYVKSDHEPLRDLKKVDLKGRKLLAMVLDEYPERAEIMALNLESFGMQPSIYAKPPDLDDSLPEVSLIVISDLANHGEYVKLIKDKYQKRELPPIFATAPLITLAAEQKSSQGDITAFFTVPIRRDRVVDLLAQHLNIEVTYAHPSRRPASGSISSDSPRNDAAGKQSTDKLRVLTVDDNKINIVVAQKFLKREAIDTDIAYDGLAAIAMVQANEYDLVLMDVQMPKLDGVTATKRIRELYQTPEYQARAPLHIIALTANAIVGDREHYLASGMNGYISKPIDRKSLQAALDEVRQGIANRTDSTDGKPHE